MSEPATPELMWRPSDQRVRDSRLCRFLEHLQETLGVTLADYDALWEWSRRDRETMAAFWSSLWDFCEVRAQTRGDTVIADFERMPGARFFPDAKLNFAENLLRESGVGDAIVFRGEDQAEHRLTHDELRERVSRVAAGLEALGVGPGDRVAACLPNLPETVIVMLAASSLGAVFSSCSPDFGVQGVLDRFGQIGPKVLFGVDGYYYNGKVRDASATLAAVATRLPGLAKTLVVHYAGAGDVSSIPGAERMDEWESRQVPGPIAFVQMPFNAPLYILFSSGTTGQPKCIVHGAGGTLLQHLKEHQLQADVRPGDRPFYFTTCGWMMWNWLVSGLASRATLMLYDGSPFYPDWRTLFRFAEEEEITHFGTSAKFIDALGNAEARPCEAFDLSSVRTILSTGSPLVSEGFDLVYRDIKADVCLSSIAGGTDIVGCFVAGNPTGPVHRGEIQARCLAMDVDVFDESGRSVRDDKGELVCRKPFPSMPLHFWNDPDGKRFFEAYFATWPGVWHHGDFASISSLTGGVTIYGRSDATLNPGGVRIGTAEIYRQVERLPEVAESIAIGQDVDGDQRVVLFVRMNEGERLTDEIAARIRDQIRRGASPRHVPAVVLEVADIPRTRSGKIVELAVRDVVHGRAVRNVEALVNPEALAHFAGREELALPDAD
jgi:acetoacetyl-CoA synthetase